MKLVFFLPFLALKKVKAVVPPEMIPYDPIVDSPGCDCEMNMGNVSEECSSDISFPDPTGYGFDNVAFEQQDGTPLEDGTTFVGTTTVVVTADCWSGDTMRAEFDVTVEDDEPPSISIQGPTVVFHIASDSGDVASDVQSVVSIKDNCDGATFTHDAPDFYTCDDIGNNIVTIEATDANGNGAFSTGSYTADVQDPSGYCNPPVVTSPAPKETFKVYEGSLFTLQVEATLGNDIGGTELTYTLSGNSDPSIFQIGSSDGVLSFVTTHAPAYDPENYTHTLQVTVTNTQGREAKVDFIINIISIEIITPGGIIVTNDPGKCTANVTYDLQILPDLDTVGYMATYASGDLFPVGETTVTIEARNKVTNGEFKEWSFTVTVVDTEPPQIITDNVLPFVLNNMGTVSANPFSSGATVTDNCDVKERAVITGPGDYSCDNVGAFPVTIYQEDINGNQASASFLATVSDENGVCGSYPGSPSLSVLTAGLANQNVGRTSNLKYSLGGQHQLLFTINDHSGEIRYNGELDVAPPETYNLEVILFRDDIEDGVYDSKMEETIQIFTLSAKYEDVFPTPTNSPTISNSPSSVPSAIPSKAPSLSPVEECTSVEYAFRCGDEINVCGSSLEAGDVSLPGPGPPPSFVWGPLKCKDLISNPCGEKCVNGKRVGAYSLHQCDGSQTVQTCPPPPGPAGSRGPRRRLGAP